MQALIPCWFGVGNKITYGTRNGPKGLINNTKSTIACRGVINDKKDLIGKINFLKKNMVVVIIVCPQLFNPQINRAVEVFFLNLVSQDLNNFMSLRRFPKIINMGSQFLNL